MASAPMLPEGLALVHASLDLRAKYRVHPAGQLLHISPAMVGFHWANASAVSSDRVANLAGLILREGFDPGEANHMAILVQEVPGSSRIHDYNVSLCADHPDLAAQVNGEKMTFGSLSQSHLNQTLKNLAAGVSVGMASVEGSPGTLSVQLSAGHHPSFAEHATNGLAWELLSHEINQDTNALRTIYAACNVKTCVAMPDHEIEAMRAISSLHFASASVGAPVLFEAVQAKIAKRHRVYAEDPNFKHVYNFVVNLGAVSPCLRDLADYVGRISGDYEAGLISHPFNSRTFIQFLIVK